MKRVAALILLLFMASPLVIATGDVMAKGEFKKELKKTLEETDENTVFLVKTALFVACGFTVILTIVPATRRLGAALGVGLIFALAGIVLFTEVFTTPMSELHNKKKMQDFFKK